ncbi:MAG: hypothetical protein ABIQ89_01900 [Candidatus Saccharimonadales bacterium]
MTNLALHPSTKQALDQFQASPSHSLMIVGSSGAGKSTVATYLVGQVIDPDKDIQKNPYFLRIIPDKNSISIEAIRQAHEFIRLKTTGSKPWRRAIIVEDAHYMTSEAQNAFLKMLEEPPADTIIVLTALSDTSVLPTISSRTQQLRVKPLAAQEAQDYFSQQGADPVEVTRAYHMSGGQIGLMTQILDTENNQQLLGHIDSAKQLLKASAFEKLVFIDQYIKQKDSIEQLLWALLAVCRAALQQASQQNKQPMVKHWQNSIKVILRAQDTLASHPLPKLLLTDLSLQL